MKHSCFNVCTYNHDGMVIYNTMTGAVIALNQYYSRMYQDIYLADSDFATNMQKGGFFVDDQKDEVAELLQISTYARENLTSRSYTIAPTLSCNFRCPYCFEDGHRYNTMTDAVIDKTIAFINNDVQEAEAVSIAWYGGEPLLCPEIIQRITENIHVKDGGFTASVITNGYFLDRKMAEFLQRQKVGYAQVTVDGPPDIHNARRRLPNGQDTFHRILSNVAEANDYLKINLRVNVDASNRDRIDEIFDFLDNYGLRGKVQLYLAAVENIHGSCNNGTCLEDHEFSAFEASFYERNVDRGYSFIYLPCFNPTICGAVTKTTMFMDSSYYTQRINNDATQIISYILEALSGIIINVVSIILPSVVIFNIFPPILPGIFLAIMLYVFAYTAMRSVLYKTGMAFKEGQSVFFKKLSQQLTAIKLIKLFDLSDLFADLLNKAFAHVLKTTINYQKKAYIFSSLDSLISSVCQILFLFSGGYMVSKNLITIGNLTIVLSYISMIITSARYFFSLGKQTQDTLVCYARISELLSSSPEFNHGKEPNNIDEISIIDLSVRFSENVILHSVNMHFEKGKIYGVAGNNGTGKTTLINILAGLYRNCYSGKIILNRSISLSEINPEFMRKNLISVCPQDISLIEGSLRSNLLLGHDEPDDFYNTLEYFGLDSVIASLPNGINTSVDNHNFNLSAGEKQKIAIVRTIIKGGCVLIFDEPTSALDTLTRDRFLAYLQNHKKNKMVIIVSHDITLLQQLDEVVRMEGTTFE